MVARPSEGEEEEASTGMKSDEMGRRVRPSNVGLLVVSDGQIAERGDIPLF